MFWKNIYPQKGQEEKRQIVVPRCAEEEQQKSRPQRENEKERAEVPPPAKMTEKGKKLKEDMDDILDKIDKVLEENAEEFVKNYVQRGGE